MSASLPPTGGTELLRGMDWWARTLAGPDPRQWDEEIQAVNALQPRQVPEWAWQAIADLPGPRFELCNQNWTSGLEECLAVIRARQLRPRAYGSCGDLHTAVRQAAETWYYVLRSWLEDAPLEETIRRAQSSFRDPDATETVARIYGALRVNQPEQRQAVSALVELLGLALRPHYRELNDRRLALAAQAETPFLALFLNKLQVLETRCNYRFMQNLYDLLEAIARPAQAEELLKEVRGCDLSLRSVLLLDPGRVETTLAYLLGVAGWFFDRPIQQVDLLAPAQAMMASRIPSRLGRQDPVSRWLAAAFIKTTKMWVERTLYLVEQGHPGPLERQRMQRIRSFLSSVHLSLSDAQRAQWEA